MPPARRPLAERFWPRVQKTATCWIWTGAKDPNGYGRVNKGGNGGRALLTHRVAYELSIGPIPNGLPLDHLCRNPSCVNPAHLEPVTTMENSLRGEHPRYLVYKSNICMKGHDRAVVGVRLYPNGRKACKQCIRESQRAWSKRKQSNG